MDLQITGTNLELSDTVQRFIERKLGKIDKHFPSIIDTRVEISEEKTKSPQQHFLVRVTVNSGIGGVSFHGEERGETVLIAVDKVAISPAVYALFGGLPQPDSFQQGDRHHFLE